MTAKAIAAEVSSTYLYSVTGTTNPDMDNVMKYIASNALLSGFLEDIVSDIGKTLK